MRSLALVLLALLAACGAEERPSYDSSERSYEAVHVAEHGNTEAGKEYARELLAADPQREAITDAWVRDDELLGIVVRSGIASQELRSVMLALMEDMAAEFRNRDLEVIAYDERTRQAVAQAIYPVESGEVIYRTAR